MAYMGLLIEHLRQIFDSPKVAIEKAAGSDKRPYAQSAAGGGCLCQLPPAGSVRSTISIGSRAFPIS